MFACEDASLKIKSGRMKVVDLYVCETALVCVSGYISLVN